MTGRKSRACRGHGWILPLWGALLLLAPAPAAAQQRIAVRTEPGTPVVALHLMVDAGPVHEAADQAGLAYLAVRTVIAPILPVLDSLGAHVAVRVEKDALAFSLIAAPDAWHEASRTLLIALFRDPPDSVAAVQERRAVLAELDAREVNPADAFAAEVDLSVFGPDHPWSRRTVGYHTTIKTLTVEDVDDFLRAHVLAERAVAAVVGPVDAASATEHLRAFLPAAMRPSAPAPLSVPAPSTVRVDYNSITTWVAAAYVFPAGADVEALRLLADLVAQSLAFGPRQRSVYDVRNEVLLHRGGGEIRIQVVVPPHEADAWAQRMLDAVAVYAAEPLAAYRFAEQLRHFRGTRLMQLNSPEARAHELARRLFDGGTAGSGLASIEELTPERLFSAARQLAEPTIVFLGPLEDAD